jgi:hypothetical protein
MGFKGYRLWVMGQLDSTYRAPPQAPRARHLRHVRAVQGVAVQRGFESKL